LRRKVCGAVKIGFGQTEGAQGLGGVQALGKGV
jgi:hypothetical protein